MKYKIAICDDDAAQRAHLISLAKEWAGQGRYVIETKEYPGAEAFLFDYAEEKDIDILLLDIEMDGMDGITLAKELRRDNDALHIVFITGYPDYIAEGYDVAALHYLMKPVKKDKLAEVLDRAVQLSKKTSPSLLISTDRETLRILLDDIYYVESQGHYMSVYTAKEEYRLRMTVSEILEKLGEGFYRCSRSYVAGLKHVSRITKSEVILENKVSLPLGRGQYNEMNQKLIGYLREL